MTSIDVVDRQSVKYVKFGPSFYRKDNVKLKFDPILKCEIVLVLYLSYFENKHLFSLKISLNFHTFEFIGLLKAIYTA